MQDRWLTPNSDFLELIETVEMEGTGQWAGRWVLFRRADKSCTPWHTLVLFAPDGLKTRPPRRKKSRFHFAWNGKRLSRNRDTGLLHKLQPQMLSWAEHVCTAMDEVA